MNNEEFNKVQDEALDEEMATLYQQRKATTVAPKINIAELQKTHKKKFSLPRMLSVLLTAGGASFAIFAIISNLAIIDTSSKPIDTISPPIAVEKLPTKVNDMAEDERYAVAIPPLPPQSKPTAKPKNIAVAHQSGQLQNQVIELPENYIQGVEVPALTQPELALKPVFKVLPKYFVDQGNKRRYGEVKLSYQINKNGTTTNIQVISSNVDRELKKSAKQALAQWKYNATGQYHEVYEIIFEFRR